MTSRKLQQSEEEEDMRQAIPAALSKEKYVCMSPEINLLKYDDRFQPTMRPPWYIIGTMKGK